MSRSLNGGRGRLFPLAVHAQLKRQLATVSGLKDHVTHEVCGQPVEVKDWAFHIKHECPGAPVSMPRQDGAA